MLPFARVSPDLPGVAYHPSRQDQPEAAQNDGSLSYWVMGLLPFILLVIFILRSVPTRIRATVTHREDPKNSPQLANAELMSDSAEDVDALEREIHAFYETEDGQKH